MHFHNEIQELSKKVNLVSVTYRPCGEVELKVQIRISGKPTIGFEHQASELLVLLSLKLL